MRIRARTKTVNLRNIEFLIEEAFTGIWRNGLMAFASISTIALSLAVLGAFALSTMSTNNFLKAQIGQFQIAVFTTEGATKEDADSLAEKIGKMDGVADVSVRDRDKEWADWKSQHPNFESAGLPRNVLPYTLDVTASEPSRLTLLATEIGAMSGVDQVQEGRETVERVIALAHASRVISVVGVLLLLVTTAFIISNAIRLTLYARRREIRIMQLVGATNETIRIPLVIEGMVFGAVGALVAWLLLRLGGTYLAHAAQSISPMLGQFYSGLTPSGLALWLLGIGVVIGAVGSFVSIRRFLRD